MDKWKKKMGILMGLGSGLAYGVYSTFVGVAGTKSPLSIVQNALVVAMVICGINDFLAGIFLTIYNAKQKKLNQMPEAVGSFAGKMVILASLLGGPIANGAYLLGIALAGAAAIPISALNVIFGTIFARIFLKQKLSKRVGLGMMGCVIGAMIINFSGQIQSKSFLLGVFCALIAAICWGLEGMISSFGGSVLDSDIAVNIRELVSGTTIIIILLPLLGGGKLFFSTLVAVSPMFFLVLSGFSAAVSYLLWYKANASIGCAMGMSLNVTYALWGVLLSVLFLGTSLTLGMMVGCVLIVIGAMIVSAES